MPAGEVISASVRRSSRGEGQAVATDTEEVRLERAEQTPGLEDWRVEEAASGGSRYGWFVLKSALVTPRRRREAREGLALTEEAKRTFDG